MRFHSEFPIALDESASCINSINDILNHNAADIIVIKPQSIGDFTKINKAIMLIREAGKKATITSSLEGKIGRFASMHLAAANQIESPCGLALEKIFLHENSEFPLICNGKISVPQQHGLGCQEYK